MHFSKALAIPCITLAGLTLCGTAHAASLFNYMQINGNAVLEGNALQFSNAAEQAGTAFLKTPLTLRSTGGFITQFQMQMQVQGNTPQADGMAFVIQNDPTGPLAQSYDGSCLDVCTLSNTVALEFLSYTNNVVTLSVNGQQTSQSFQLGNQTDVLDVTVGYSEAFKTLAFAAYNEKTGATISNTWHIDLHTLGPSVYLGFSGATGGATSLQTVNQWQLFAW